MASLTSRPAKVAAKGGSTVVRVKMRPAKNSRWSQESFSDGRSGRNNTSSQRRTKGRARAKELHRAAESYAAGNGFTGPTCALLLSRGLCISHRAVGLALERARRALRFRRPSGLNSLEPSESTINAVGELNEMATRILASQFGLSLDEIHFELERLDVGQTSLWRTCPAVFRSPPICASPSRFRTHSGRCNNLFGGHLGSANMPFVRLLPPDYGDGVGSPRLSTLTRSPLPPARLLALSLHPDLSNPTDDHSALYMSWGQLINHDLAQASGARGKYAEYSSYRFILPIMIVTNSLSIANPHRRDWTRWILLHEADQLESWPCLHAHFNHRRRSGLCAL